MEGGMSPLPMSESDLSKEHCEAVYSKREHVVCALTHIEEDGLEGHARRDCVQTETSKKRNYDGLDSFSLSFARYWIEGQRLSKSKFHQEKER
jgi:hypothetical protein